MLQATGQKKNKYHGSSTELLPLFATSNNIPARKTYGSIGFDGIRNEYVVEVSPVLNFSPRNDAAMGPPERLHNFKFNEETKTLAKQAFPGRDFNEIANILNAIINQNAAKDSKFHYLNSRQGIFFADRNDVYLELNWPYPINQFYHFLKWSQLYNIDVGRREIDAICFEISELLESTVKHLEQENKEHAEVSVEKNSKLFSICKRVFNHVQ